MTDTQNPSPENQEFFPIRELSARTGVNTVTLRAWERRHGLLKPLRTGKGHRLYKAEDVKRVEQILGWINRGVSVGRVRALIENSPPADNTPDEQNAHWQDSVEHICCAAKALSGRRIEQLLNENFKLYPPQLCIEHLLEPALQQLPVVARIYLESVILQFALLSLHGKVNTNRGPEIWLVRGIGSPAWRLATAALPLADAGFQPQLLNQALGAPQWLALAKVNGPAKTLVYQEARWGDRDLALVCKRRGLWPQLLACGAAAALAPELEGLRRFATLEQAVAELLTAT